jgi:hypothetical protein
VKSKMPRATIAAKARQDVVACRSQAHGTMADQWQRCLIEAWTNTRNAFAMSARDAIELWPVYWRAFSEETTKLRWHAQRSRAG